MREYSSMEEFIYRNGRYPDTTESRQLLEALWERYLEGCSEEERQIAVENDRLGKEFNQDEIRKRIPLAARRLQAALEGNRSVIRSDYYEYWGAYQLLVTVACKKKSELHLLRDRIPNYFEGWYVTLRRATRIQKLYWRIRFFLLNFLNWRRCDGGRR